jgi:hypothetical protein
MRQWQLSALIAAAATACAAGDGDSLYGCGGIAVPKVGTDAGNVDGMPGPDSAVPLAWQYLYPIEVTSAEELADIAVLIEFDPAMFDTAHAAADGADLRVSSSPEQRLGFDVPHFIERFDPAGTSRVWMRVPSLTAATPTTFYLFTGNPQASDTSSHLNVFPNQLVTTGDLALAGAQQYDWVSVNSSHTVRAGMGQILEIRARVIEIGGTIDAAEKGHSGGLDATGGSGSGGGGAAASASGAGGGGYGGSGGAGGFDGTEVPGAGGAAYGTATGSDIDLGSGGAGVSGANGGNGGGAVVRVAHTIRIRGTVSVAGAPGGGCGGGGQCAGGGSGGGISLTGRDLELTGVLVAQGGNGGTGSGNNDGGGGGGGGRIKIVHSGSLVDTASKTAPGGVAGCCDGASNGSTGSIHVGTAASTDPVVTLGAEQALF